MIVGFHDLEGLVTAGDTQGVEQFVVTHAQERLRVVHQIEDQRFRARLLVIGGGAFAETPFILMGHTAEGADIVAGGVRLGPLEHRIAHEEVAYAAIGGQFMQTLPRQRVTLFQALGQFDGSQHVVKRVVGAFK